MYKIKTLNKIDAKGLERLGKEYEITENEAVTGIILRSYKMHDYEFPKELRCIARAGAGVNNIPIERCTKSGIVVFNTPGANANAVKEMTLTGMLLACRDVIGAIDWIENADTAELGVAKTVEKNKSNFKGGELLGKTLGVIGAGAIGYQVANMGVNLGMDVIVFDPYLSINRAIDLDTSVRVVKEEEELFANSDFISIHVPLSDATKGYLGEEAFEKMKEGAVLLNFSRGGLVDDEALLKNIENGKLSKYVVDFPNENLLGKDKVICIPHLGASTFEAETNCAIMAVNELKDYLENGNILNSVNFPNCSLGLAEKGKRLSILSSEEKREAIDSVIFNAGKTINKFNSATKNSNLYALYDFDEEVDDKIVKELLEKDLIIKCRII